jgi:hypothetical protein
MRNIIAHLAKVSDVAGPGGVGKIVMEAFPLPKPDGTLLCSRIANCDNEIEGHIPKFVGGL